MSRIRSFLTRPRPRTLYTVTMCAVLLAAACSNGDGSDVPASDTPAVQPTPTSPDPPTDTSTPTPPAEPPTPEPGPDRHASCVAPDGMTKLIDQDPSDEQKPWKMPAGANHVEIWFSAPVSAGFNDEWIGYVNKGAAVWNKSPCLDVHVTQDACPDDKNCVKMAVVKSGDDGNFDAVEKHGYTTGGNIEILSSLGKKPDGGERRNVTAHEMGHAVGLVHRKAHVLMNGDTYDDVFDADATEYKNLLFDYGRQRE